MEIKHIQVDKADQETGYLELTSVVAEVIKIVKADTGYSLIGLRDFTGAEIVALIRGKGRPTRNEVGTISVFMLSGQTKGNKVQYSGFYNPKDEIPAQYQGKRPPKPAEESSDSGRGSGGRAGGSRDSNRGFALSYAKDLACAGAITMKQLQGVAVQFTTYLDTGSWGVQKEAPVPAGAGRTAPPVEREAPITQPTLVENEIPEVVEEDQSRPVEESTPTTYPEGAFGDDTPF